MKKLLLALLVLILGVSFYFFLVKDKPHMPVRITLPDGTSASIRAVTYGTNHVVGSALARAVVHLPDWMHDLLPDMLLNRVGSMQSMVTAEPTLVVWLDRRTNSAGVIPPGSGYYNAFLADGSNFVSGGAGFLNSYLPGSLVEGVPFRMFPRRDPEITLKIFYHAQPGGVTNCGILTFANPVYHVYPEWTPEPLPATKRIKDLEVTLLGVHTGQGNNSTLRPRKGGGAKVTFSVYQFDGPINTAVELNLHPLTEKNEVWQVAGEEVSDATGNMARNSGMMSWNNQDTFSFNPSLWPGEKAWKLEMEIKRTSGFLPEETFTFKDVPIGELDHTNVIAWTTNFAGVAVTLQYIYRRAPNTNSSWSSADFSGVKFTTSTLPAGTHFDLLGAVFTPGKTNQTESWESSANERTYRFREIPLDATTADFTFAVQQSRTVEFMVKPELPDSTPSEDNSTTDAHR